MTASSPLDVMINRYSDAAGDRATVACAVQSLLDAEGHLDDDTDPQPHSALKVIATAKDCFEQAKHTVGCAEVSRLVARAIALLDREGEASDLLKSNLAEYEATGHQRAKAIVKLAQAEVLLSSPDRSPTDVQEAIVAANQAADLLDGLGDGSDTRVEASVQIALAKLHGARRSSQEALDAANRAVVASQAAGDMALLAKATNQLGKAHELSEEVDNCQNGLKQGIQAYKNALALFQELGLKAQIGYQLRDTGRCMIKCLYKPKTVKDMASQAFRIFQELGRPRAAITCLELLVEAGIKYRDYSAAAKEAFEGVAFFKRFKDSHQPVVQDGAAVDDFREISICMARAWMLVCQVHIAEGQAGTAVDAVGNAVDLVKNLNAENDRKAGHYKAYLLRILLLKAKAQCADQSFSDAHGTLKEAKELAKVLASMQKHGDKAAEGAVLGCEVDVHLASGDREAAAQAADDQRDVYQRLGMKSLEVSALLKSANCLGDKTSDTSELTRAISRAKDARELSRTAKDEKAEVDALLMIAKLCQLNENAEDALEASTDLLSILKKMPQAIKAQGQACAHLARSYLEMNVFDEALRNSEAALGFAKRSEDPLLEAEVLIMVAEVNYGAAIRQDQETKEGVAIFHKCAAKSWQSAKLAKARCERFNYKDLLPIALCAMAEVGPVFDADLATTSAQEAENLYTNLEDDIGVATAVVLQANILYHKGENAAAKNMAEKGLSLAQEAGAPADLIADAQDIIQRTASAAPARKVSDVQQVAAVANTPAAEAAPVAVEKAGLDLAVVTETVQKIVASSVAADEDIELDTPLMDAGLDSLASVAFRNTLMNELHMKLPGALMFDYPNIRLLSDFIVEKSQE